MASEVTDNAWLRALRTDRIWQLMAVNLLVFLGLHIASWCGVSDAALASAVALPADFASAVTHPWTVVVYMFVQYDFFHFIFNMMWLWTFGMLMMRLMVSGRTILTAYFAGGLAAAAVWLALGAMGLARDVLLGSSAAVLSVIAAGGVILGRTRVELMLFGSVQVRWLALAIIGLCILTDGTVQGAATVAVHATGVAAGALTGVPALRLSRRRASHVSDADDQRTLDALLDKVHKGGYGALSAAERNKLFTISSRLSKK